MDLFKDYNADANIIHQTKPHDKSLEHEDSQATAS